MISKGNLFIDRIVNEIKSYQQLVAAEKGELKVRPTRIWVQNLVATIHSLFLPIISKKELQLNVIFDTCQDASFSADETVLLRVIENMLKNAIEACSVGDLVTLEVTQKGEELEFSVKNPQVMPKVTRLQMFKRTFSTKGKGRGLGTYSIKMLTERYLNGRVTFASSNQSGTCFTISLPLTQG